MLKRSLRQWKWLLCANICKFLSRGIIKDLNENIKLDKRRKEKVQEKKFPFSGENKRIWWNGQNNWFHRHWDIWSRAQVLESDSLGLNSNSLIYWLQNPSSLTSLPKFPLPWNEDNNTNLIKIHWELKKIIYEKKAFCSA